MSEARLSFLHPVAWLRTMFRLPGYAIAVRRRRRKMLAALFLGVVALIWIGTAVPVLLIGPPPANALFHGFGEFLLLLFGRVMGNGYLCVAAAATGALAFAPERRNEAMDQLLMTPAPRSAVFLGRAVGTAIPLVPAVLLASSLDVGLLPLLARNATGRSPLLLLLVAATLGVSTFSAVVWSYSLGLLASLRSRTVTRALVWSLVLLACAGALEVVWYFAAGLATMATAGGKAFLLCYWFLALLRVILAALVMWLCVASFDRMALGDEAR